MQIVDMDWARRVPFYTIHCSCDTFFTCKVNEKGQVKCPTCKLATNIHSLRRDWEENPAPVKELIDGK